MRCGCNCKSKTQYQHELTRLIGLTETVSPRDERATPLIYRLTRVRDLSFLHPRKMMKKRQTK